MTQHEIHVDGLVEALDLGWSFANYMEDHAALLTTEHPTASRGLPVLVMEGVAYGPGDLPSVTLVIGNTERSGAAMIEPARAAGWRVKVVEIEA